MKMFIANANKVRQAYMFAYLLPYQWP